MKIRFFSLLLALPLLTWAQAPRILFDGVSLKGWKILGTGSWTVANGAISGKLAKSNPQFTQLIFDSVVTDFKVSFQFRHVKGNAGFFFRMEEQNPPPPENVLGVQLVIEPTLQSTDAFGLYETNGRGWIKKWDYPALKSLPKSGDWNSVIITAHGSSILVEMNGSELVKLDDPTGRRQGELAFKMHGDQDVEIEFKDVSILPAVITGLVSSHRQSGHRPIQVETVWPWKTSIFRIDGRQLTVNALPLSP